MSWLLLSEQLWRVRSRLPQPTRSLNYLSPGTTAIRPGHSLQTTALVRRDWSLAEAWLYRAKGRDVTPERHQKADHLYHAALEVEPDSRAAFLDDACAGDEELRRAAESMLRAHYKGDNDFEEPTLKLAAGAVAERQSLSLAGKNLSHYRVLSLIGAGGMGEVHLAEDMRLGRRLALKLLPASVTNDAERVHRFEQEARAASALNHPNILTIYDIGEVDGCHFIATEYVKGETLRQRMSGNNISLKDALDIIVQIADALSAAHKVGVVHRDIKPENIMIRQDGYIKVLDFGLAKLTERTTTDGRSERGLLPLVSTEPGLVMGTPQYMSPEQVRGIDVDERTDIFSLGIVFYEVLAGRPPFEGSTVSDLIAAILHKEPPPINESASGVSVELQRIIRRILLKDKEERYQSVEEFLFDIERLKSDEKNLDHHHPTLPRLSGRADTQAITETTKAEARAETPKGILVQSINVPGHRTLRIQNVLHSIKRHKSAALLTLAALFLVSTAIVYLVYRPIRPSSFDNDSTSRSQGIKITRIANTGEALSLAISPDGKYIAYTAGDGAKPSIWIKQVTTSNSIQIVPPIDGIYGNLAFSVSGDFIYYNVVGSGLYQVSILGGTSRKIFSAGLLSSFSLSPDEKKVALVEAEKTLVVANVDGTDRREIRKPADYELFSSPAWSPDGKSIAYTASTNDYCALIQIRLDSEAITIIGSQKWKSIGEIAWLSNGSGLIVTASDEGSQSIQIWYVSYPGGEARRITNDLNHYTGISLTRNASTLATIQSTSVYNIEVASVGDISQGKQITHGSSAYKQPSYLPDGRIVYEAIGSTADIWIMDANGTNQKQLTYDEENSFPLASPDGRYIVFVSNRNGNRGISRMDVDGNNSRQLTSDKNKFFFYPQTSPDSKWLIYNTSDDAGSFLWKLPIDGGEPVRLIEHEATSSAISPDGTLLAYFYRNRDSNSDGIAVIPIEGGQPIRTYKVSESLFVWNPFLSPRLCWIGEGRVIAYLDENGTIWSLPIDGGLPKQLASFKSGRLQIRSYDLSRDGKNIVYTRSSGVSDVVLLTDFR